MRVRVPGGVRVVLHVRVQLFCALLSRQHQPLGARQLLLLLQQLHAELQLGGALLLELGGQRGVPGAAALQLVLLLVQQALGLLHLERPRESNRLRHCWTGRWWIVVLGG